MSVRMLTERDHEGPESGLEIELILDSGADASCLPLDLCDIGEPAKDGLEHTPFTDAQGNRLQVSSSRRAVLNFPDSAFTETFLVANVGNPILAVGKLYRAGFGVFHEEDQMYLGNDEVKIPVYLRNNSLATKCHIRMLRGTMTSACQPQIRALKCNVDQLGDLPDYFHQIGTDLFALKCYTTHNVDVAMALPHEGCGFRSTLLKGSDGQWSILEWCESIDSMMECSAALPGNGAHHVIVIASRQVVSPEDVGLHVFGDQPELPEPQESLEANDQLDVEAPQQHAPLPPDDPAQAQVEAALRDEPVDGSVVVDGVTLSLANTLASLRQAAQNLGLGRSGGKQTVLKRIRDHLSRQQLIASHQAMLRARSAEVRDANEPPHVHQPSPAEIAQHSLTHMPYKSWCMHCVAFRARADKHTQIKETTRTHSILSFDFCFTSRAAEEHKLCCLVAHDEHTKWIQAWSVPSKGGTTARNFMATELTRLSAYLGHREITIRADPEPSCTALADSVQALRSRIGMKTHVEQTPVGEHQSNFSEGAVERIRQHVGTMLAEVEQKLGTAIKTGDPIHSWAWRHSSWVLQRFAVAEGLTAYERVHQAPYTGKIVRFCECVLARVRGAEKGKPRWQRALWLGKSDVSDCHLVCTAAGKLLSVRSIRRTAMEYDSTLLAALRDTPDQQVSFLAGKVGSSRKQISPKAVEDQGPRSGSEVAATPPESGEEEIVDDPLDIAPAPSSVQLPAEGVGLAVPATPDEPAQSRERLPPPPGAALAVGPQDIDVSMGVNPSLTIPSQEMPGSPIGNMELDVPMPSELPEPQESVEAKRRSIQVLHSSHQHSDEVVLLSDLQLVEDSEPSDSVEYPPYEGEDPSTEEVLNAPDVLWRPFHLGEPTLSPAELADIDAVAEQYELDRLIAMQVLEPLSPDADKSGFRKLSTRMVNSWRVKPRPDHGDSFLRRARFVAREFRWMSSELDDAVFAPASSSVLTRVLPALLVSKCAAGEDWHALSLDITNAYLTVPQQTPTIVSWQVGNQLRWYRLLRTLPGQRTGARSWFDDFHDHLRSTINIEAFTEAPALFCIPVAKDGGGTAAGGGGLSHVDDVFAAGSVLAMSALRSSVKGKYKCTIQELRQVGEEISFLKRRHAWVNAGIDGRGWILGIFPNPKHIQYLAELLGVTKQAKKSTPLPTGTLPLFVQEDLISDDQAALYRKCVGILLYISPDVPAAQYAIKTLASFCGKPNVGAWKCLRHLANYLFNSADHVLCLETAGKGRGHVTRSSTSHVLEVFCDSDWAGNKSSRKSTSAGVLMFDGMTVHTFSRSQSCISLSSAEAEYVAAVSSVCDGILLRSAFEHLTKEHVEMHVYSDSSACRGIIGRQGCGKLRHISGRLLWLQDFSTRQRLATLHPIPTLSNPADLMTKSLSGQRIAYLSHLINVRDAASGFRRVGEDEFYAIQEREEAKKFIRSVKKLNHGGHTNHGLRVLSLLLQIVATESVEHSLSSDDHGDHNGSGDAHAFDFRPDHAESAWSHLLAMMIVAVIIVCCTGFLIPLGFSSFNPFMWILAALGFSPNLTVDPSATSEEAATDPDAHDAMPPLEPLDEDDATSNPFDQHSPRTRAMILDETPPATPSVASVQPEFEPDGSDADDTESDDGHANDVQAQEIIGFQQAVIMQAPNQPIVHAALNFADLVIRRDAYVWYAPVSGVRYHWRRTRPGLRNAAYIGQMTYTQMIAERPHLTLCYHCRMWTQELLDAQQHRFLNQMYVVVEPVQAEPEPHA